MTNPVTLDFLSGIRNVSEYITTELVPSLEPGRRRLLALTGCSGSGKGGVGKVLGYLNPALVEIIPMDMFYNHTPREEGDQAAQLNTNYDEPAAFDEDLFFNFLTRFKQGESGLLLPQYDFATSSQGKPKKLESPGRIGIVDGLFPAHNDRLKELYTEIIFVGADSEDLDGLKYLNACLGRRIARDLQRSGATEETTRRMWEETVLPGYLEHGLPQRGHARWVLENNVSWTELREQAQEMGPEYAAALEALIDRSERELGQ